MLGFLIGLVFLAGLLVGVLIATSSESHDVHELGRNPLPDKFKIPKNPPPPPPKPDRIA